MSLRVVKPGALSSLQDLGRAGYQRFGVIASGVMDEWSHRVANLLVGNACDEATLEITLLGPSLVFEASTLVCLTGADLAPRIAGSVVPMNRPVLVRKGAQLDFGGRVSGCRAYLAVHGGFAVEPVMGSRSTYLRAGLGGFEGRALRKGDVLATGGSNHLRLYPGLGAALEASGDPFVSFAESRFAPVDHPSRRLARARGADPATDAAAPGDGEPTITIRAIAGQQWEAFDEAARKNFFGSPYLVGLNSDRMGFRMEGPALGLRAPLEMISQGVTFGTVQVPPDGQPIVLMADRQTAGGYPKIASVAAVDLPLLAQCLPRDAVRFERVTLDHAQRLLLAREQALSAVRESTEQLTGD